MNKRRLNKIKKLNLKWYALIHRFGDDKVVPYNVLYDDIVYQIAKCIEETEDYETIKEKTRRELMCMFWSRSEYEIIVSNWGGKAFKQKIDIWYQLYANLDLIAEYLVFKLAPRRYKKIMATRKDVVENNYL